MADNQTPTPDPIRWWKIGILLTIAIISAIGWLWFGDGDLASLIRLLTGD